MPYRWGRKSPPVGHASETSVKGASIKYVHTEGRGTKINIKGFGRGDHLSEYKDYFINRKLHFEHHICPCLCPCPCQSVSVLFVGDLQKKLLVSVTCSCPRGVGVKRPIAFFRFWVKAVEFSDQWRRWCSLGDSHFHHKAHKALIFPQWKLFSDEIPHKSEEVLNILPLLHW